MIDFIEPSAWPEDISVPLEGHYSQGFSRSYLESITEKDAHNIRYRTSVARSEQGITPVCCYFCKEPVQLIVRNDQHGISVSFFRHFKECHDENDNPDDSCPQRSLSLSVAESQVPESEFKQRTAQAADYRQLKERLAALLAHERNVQSDTYR